MKIITKKGLPSYDESSYIHQSMQPFTSSKGNSSIPKETRNSASAPTVQRRKLSPEEILFGDPQPARTVRGSNPFQAEVVTTRPYLAPRLQRVAKLVIEGKSNKQIAQALNLSPGTVKVYTVALYHALGVTCRFEVMALGFQHAAKMLLNNETEVDEKTAA